MKLMKIVVGLILIAAGIWAYIGIEDTTWQLIVSIVLVALGLLMLFMCCKKGNKSTGTTPPAGGDMKEEQGPTPPPVQ